MRIEPRIVGTPPHQRYTLVREHDGAQECWDGTGWSGQNALLYYAEQDMAADYERLELDQVSHLPERVFVAPVVIRVRSGEDFSLRQLQEHLFAAARLHLYPDRGEGPVPGSVVFLDIEWNGAVEITPEGGEKPPGDEGRQA